MDYLDTIIFVALAILPGLIWLFFFLREDKHPEPGRMILKVFLFGALLAIPVIALFVVIEPFLEVLLSLALGKLLIIVAFAPIIEEVAKYLAVRTSVLYHTECDEPVDIMIYAVTAALGFATVENILFLLPLGVSFSLQEVVMGSFMRFIGATLLHAIASAIMGYFLALSVMKKKKRMQFVIGGLVIAILLHSAYNLLLVIQMAIIFIPLLLGVSLVVVLLCFKKLRNSPVTSFDNSESS